MRAGCRSGLMCKGRTGLHPIGPVPGLDRPVPRARAALAARDRPRGALRPGKLPAPHAGNPAAALGRPVLVGTLPGRRSGGGSSSRAAADMAAARGRPRRTVTAFEDAAVHAGAGVLRSASTSAATGKRSSILRAKTHEGLGLPYQGSGFVHRASSRLDSRTSQGFANGTLGALQNTWSPAASPTRRSTAIWAWFQGVLHVVGHGFLSDAECPARTLRRVALYRATRASSDRSLTATSAGPARWCGRFTSTQVRPSERAVARS